MALGLEHNQIKMLRTRTMRGRSSQNSCASWPKGFSGIGGRGVEEGQLDSVLDLGFALCAALSSPVQSSPVRLPVINSYQGNGAK